MGQTRAVVVALGLEKNLRLVLQTPEGFECVIRSTSAERRSARGRGFFRQRPRVFGDRIHRGDDFGFVSSRFSLGQDIWIPQAIELLCKKECRFRLCGVFSHNTYTTFPIISLGFFRYLLNYSVVRFARKRYHGIPARRNRAEFPYREGKGVGVPPARRIPALPGVIGGVFPPPRPFRRRRRSRSIWA
jgi:hypothetical protein